MSDESHLGIAEKTTRFAEKRLDEVGKFVSDPVAGSREKEQYLLPPKLRDALAGSMKEMQYPLDDEPGRLRDFSRQWHRFYKARVKNGYLAFLYACNNILMSSAHGNELAWIGMLFSQNGAKGIYIFSDSSSVDDVYETLADNWEIGFGVTRAKFFPQDRETKLLSGDSANRRSDLQEWLKLKEFEPAVQNSERTQFINLVENHNNRKNRIMEIIIGRAKAVPGLTPQEYLQYLVDQTNWPEERKVEFSGTWKGYLPFDVSTLVKFALSQRENPKHTEYTMIGGLLEALIPEVDGDAQKDLFEIIRDYDLIRDKDVIEEIHKMITGG